MIRVLLLELFYSAWFIGAAYVIFVAVSDALFGFQEVGERLKILGIRVLLAPVWPLAALSRNGRKRIFTSMRGTNP